MIRGSGALSSFAARASASVRTGGGGNGAGCGATWSVPRGNRRGGAAAAARAAGGTGGGIGIARDRTTGSSISGRVWSCIGSAGTGITVRATIRGAGRGSPSIAFFGGGGAACVRVVSSPTERVRVVSSPTGTAVSLTGVVRTVSSETGRVPDAVRGASARAPGDRTTGAIGEGGVNCDAAGRALGAVRGTPWVTRGIDGTEGAGVGVGVATRGTRAVIPLVTGALSEVIG